MCLSLPPDFPEAYNVFNVLAINGLSKYAVRNWHCAFSARHISESR